MTWVILEPRPLDRGFNAPTVPRLGYPEDVTLSRITFSELPQRIFMPPSTFLNDYRLFAAFFVAFTPGSRY